MATFSVNNEIRQHIQAEYAEWRAKILAYDLEEEVKKKKERVLIGEYVRPDGNGGHVSPPMEEKEQNLIEFEAVFEQNIERIKKAISFLQINDYQTIINEYIVQITTILKNIKNIAPSQMFLFWHYYQSDDACLHVYPVQDIFLLDGKGSYKVQNHDFTSDAVHRLTVANELYLLMNRDWDIGAIEMPLVYDLLFTYYQLHFFCLAEAFAHPTVIKKITRQKNLVLPFKVAVQIYSSDTDFLVFELNQQP
jgi:hypothetical protein